MLKISTKLFRLLSKQNKYKLYRFFILLTLYSFIEALALALIIPYLTILKFTANISDEAGVFGIMYMNLGLVNDGYNWIIVSSAIIVLSIIIKTFFKYI